MTRQAAKVDRGPILSQAGPAANRTSSVAQSAMMLELAISILVRLRSFLIVSFINGGKAYCR